jgi:hypothetical protein
VAWDHTTDARFLINLTLGTTRQKAAAAEGDVRQRVTCVESAATADGDDRRLGSRAPARGLGTAAMQAGMPFALRLSPPVLFAI